ncbi:SPP1 gp7 family putative phage head morphogenesis protein [Chelatococcus caeni]|uniref:SPP1 gp7 family putative phage head morphogenesis protein n=1 Tax=Chelatococcus caeni TaxID=1348468 RepID=A0A840BWP7_9HYPH|nr:phage minor head protein [Chelatococcus caeni]MBB4017370.1 SPP1 gp7 family putative phage head morphogenesis protein [Chelatococcus caeni]
MHRSPYRTRDRAAGRSQRSAFTRARKLEARYAAQLRRIARHVGEIVEAFPPGDPEALPRLDAALQRYAETIRPWAEAVGQRMVSEIAARDERAWMQASREMAAELRREIRTAPTGQAMREALAEQVKLITSLPTEAAERVHRLTLEGIENASRASEIAKEIMRSGEVTESRANLIARTEVGRVSTELTKARAKHIGSTGYIWRTAGDSDVRDSHRRMAGKFVAWDDPPTLDGLTGHAGALPNCRCYPEPVIPEE